MVCEQGVGVYLICLSSRLSVVLAGIDGGAETCIASVCVSVCVSGSVSICLYVWVGVFVQVYRIRMNIEYLC